jgi:cation:H+ antiporter
MASRWGISSVVIGLTVVAFGTSAPELAVSVNASLGGNSDVAFGNVVGSNVVNILLILGLSAAVGALAVTPRIVRVDVPILMGVSLLAFALGADRTFSRMDGFILVAGAIGYTYGLMRSSRSQSPHIDAHSAENTSAVEDRGVNHSVVANVFLFLTGLVILAVGSQVIVDSAVEIAKNIGVSDLVIGLTVVSVGTALPELTTSVLASLRGQRDIAVGNVIGSNLFNILLVLGMSALVSSDGVKAQESAIRLDIPVMLAATAALLLMCWNGFRITRREGGVLVGFYVLYVMYLLFESNDHSATGVLGQVGLIAAGCLIVVLCVVGYQNWRKNQATIKAQQR